MSSVNFLEKLLDDVDVKWIEVGELISPQRGKRLVRSQLEETGSYAVYQNSMKPLGYYHESNTQAEATFVIVAGAAGEVGFSDAEFWAADDVYFFPASNAVKNKYLYHFLLTKQHEISSQVRRASIPRLSIVVIEKLKIPIPCPENPKKSLEIQAEIVRILDAMTAHAAELTAELSDRKKQYIYYRDKLLSFEDGEVEWKALGELGTWYGGGTPSKSNPDYWENGTIPWISPKDMGEPIVTTTEDYITEAAVKESSTKLLPANSIAIVVRSSILDKKLPSALIPIPAALNQDMKALFPYDWVLPSYMSHLIRSRGEDILRVARKSGGSVASIDSKRLFSFKVPIPSISEQNRIVTLLDNFDTLANSITEGLPREIELRQKQYAYYRDLLLSFPQAQAA